MSSPKPFTSFSSFVDGLLTFLHWLNLDSPLRTLPLHHFQVGAIFSLPILHAIWLLGLYHFLCLFPPTPTPQKKPPSLRVLPLSVPQYLICNSTTWLSYLLFNCQSTFPLSRKLYITSLLKSLMPLPSLPTQLTTFFLTS